MNLRILARHGGKQLNSSAPSSTTPISDPLLPSGKALDGTDKQTQKSGQPNMVLKHSGAQA